MYIDARKLENNSLIEGDICIIGAGAAGISIALDWLDTPHKVILLESGGFEYDTKVQKLYKGKNTGQKYYPLMSSRLHYFGGSTGHWGGMCSPLDDIDFEKRDWVEHSGWPISKEDLEPFYKKSINILDLPSSDFSLNYWQNQDSNRVNLPINESAVWNKMWQFSPPTRFGIKYKEKIIKANNIFLYTYANVTNIVANESVSRINHLTIKNHSGKTHKVKAKRFILACGGIENARLLLASNSQIAQGIGNQNGNVGRYFMEHVEMKSAELWLTKSLVMDLYMVKWSKPKTKARAELAITSFAQKKYKILNGTASLKPLDVARSEESNIEHWTNQDPKKNSLGNSKWERIKSKIFLLNESIVPNINKAFELYTRIEQAPNPNSRVTLDKQKDALGVHRANLHWEFTNLEKRSIRKIYELIGQQVGMTDIGRVKLMEHLQDLNDDTMPEFTSGGWHHMGTTRMAIDCKKGVVDKNCKIHGLNNIYIAGSSCFPTVGAANPTLTIVALSLRLSDYLKKII